MKIKKHVGKYISCLWILWVTDMFFLYQQVIAAFLLPARWVVPVVHRQHGRSSVLGSKPLVFFFFAGDDAKN